MRNSKIDEANMATMQEQTDVSQAQFDLYTQAANLEKRKIPGKVVYQVPEVGATDHRVDSNIIAFPTRLESDDYDELTRANKDAAANRKVSVGRKIASMIRFVETRPDHLLKDHVEQTVLDHK